MSQKKNGKERTSSPGNSIAGEPTVKSDGTNVPKNTNEAHNQEKTARKPTILQSHGYSIGRSIGNGSYANVKLAFSEKHQSHVAVKIVSKFEAPPDYLNKFLPREIDVVKGLKHNNIIRFLQAIETTHRVYIIMEYAENGSLLDIIRRDEFIDEVRSKKWFKQLGDAVTHCHGHGVVHRDIKCENLLMDHNFIIKLSDFGFARMEPERKGALSETFCGSYAYASPEILRGVPYHPKLSDIWSMGVVLFAMVYGRLPFDDANYQVLLKQIKNRVQFPKKPRVSAMCRSLISRILTPARVRLRLPVILDDPWLKEDIQKLSSDNASDNERSGSEAFSSDSEAVPVALVTKETLKAAASPRRRLNSKVVGENELTDEEGGTTENETGIREIEGRETDTEDSTQNKK